MIEQVPLEYFIRRYKIQYFICYIEYVNILISKKVFQLQEEGECKGEKHFSR